MTEKRFSYKLDEIFDEGNHFAYALSRENAEDIVKLLNELVDENKQLEKEIKKLKCINKQVEDRLENSGIGIALDMGGCE